MESVDQVGSITYGVMRQSAGLERNERWIDVVPEIDFDRLHRTKKSRAGRIPPQIRYARCRIQLRSLQQMS